MANVIRTAAGDLVARATLFSGNDPSLPLQGGDVSGIVRTADGALVVRVAVFQVEGGVAIPATKLGSDVGTDLTADPPLQMTNDGDGKGTMSILTDQPGGVPTLDGSGLISSSELPPLDLHTTFVANSEAEMTSAGAEPPSLCIRTDFTPSHVFFLPSGDGSVAGNWHDTGVIAPHADPTAQVGLTPVNGSAGTSMRSDAAPALDQSIAPQWTGAHQFTAEATQSTPSVGVASDNPQLELRRTTSDADEKRWNLRAFQDQLSLRALTDAGDVADTAWLLTRSGGTVTAHSFHVGGNAYLTISTASDIVAAANLHMSGNRIRALGDPQQDTDAVNQQTLQAAIAALAAVATSGQYSDLSGRPIVRDSGTVALHLAGEELIWPNDVSTGKLRLYNSTPGSDNTYYGFGILNQTLVYQVDGSGSVHQFQSVDDSDTAVVLLEISDDGAIVAHRALHMSEQKIHNVGDPDSARDAANKQYVDNAVAGAGSGIMAVQAHENTDSVTLAAGDPRVQLCDAFGLSSPLQVTLPDNPPTGTVFTIKLAGAADQNVVVSNPNATIDGMDSATLSTLNDFITVVYDGQHWQIIATSGS